MHLLSASYVLRAKCVLGSREIMMNESVHILLEFVSLIGSLLCC